MHLQPGSSKYKTAIKTARNQLLESQKMIRSIRGVGYEVVSPNDYPEEARKRITRSVNEVREGHKITAFAPIDKMSFQKQNEIRLLQDRSAAYLAHSNAMDTEMKLLATNRVEKKLTASK